MRQFSRPFGVIIPTRTVVAFVGGAATASWVTRAWYTGVDLVVVEVNHYPRNERA